jgi:hypothetical protein
MKCKNLMAILASGLITLLLRGAGFGSASAAEVDLYRTNFLTRWITNEIEVKMPQNYFVNEYHTNYYDEFHTNYASRYVTNYYARNLTNIIPITVFHTNAFTVYKTNLHNLQATNVIAIDVTRTNFFDHYQTNVAILNLTNWNTVLVMKTNWVNQSVTNVAQIDLATGAPASKEAAPVTSAAPSADELTIDASRTDRAPGRTVAEVRLKLKGNEAASVHIQQWRVESEDGSILCLGQDKEFKRELPVGRYKVEARFRHEANGPLSSVKGHLALSLQDAVMAQPLAAMK